MLSHVWLFATPWNIACQAPLSIVFHRQDTGVGRHFLFQEIFQTQGSNPCLLCLLHWQVDSLPLYHLGSPLIDIILLIFINIIQFRKNYFCQILGSHWKNTHICTYVFWRISVVLEFRIQWIYSLYPLEIIKRIIFYYFKFI